MKVVGVPRMILEALIFGAIALVPLCMLTTVTTAIRPLMKVTITYNDNASTTEVYTDVTSYSSDGETIKLTGKNAAGIVVTLEVNWTSVRKVVQEHQG